LRLMLENFKHTYKILLYKTVVALISLALCAAILVPQLVDLWQSEPVTTIVENFQSFIQGLFTANATELAKVKETVFSENGALHRLVKLLSSEASGIILSLIGCVIVYVLKRYVDTLCYFAVGSALNDKMSTYAETPLYNAFVANLGKSLVYALVFVPVACVFDCLIFLCLVSAFILFDWFFALFLFVTITVALQALRLTFTCYWMPAMTTDNKGLSAAMKYENKAEKRLFGRIYVNYVAVVYLIIIVNVVAAFTTIGSALLITIPGSFFFLICQQYVNYYTIKGKKYFITYDRIATNPDKGDRAHFFEYIDETAVNDNQAVEEQGNENNGEK